MLYTIYLYRISMYSTVVQDKDVDIMLVCHKMKMYYDLIHNRDFYFRINESQRHVQFNGPIILQVGIKRQKTAIAIVSEDKIHNYIGTVIILKGMKCFWNVYRASTDIVVPKLNCNS